MTIAVAKWCRVASSPVFLALALTAGCSEHPLSGSTKSGEALGTAQQAFTTSNALEENGFTTNGIWQNGLWQNGRWANGRWANSLWENGRWANGRWANGRWANGIWENGRWANGIWENGRWANGLWDNGRWANGADAEALASSAYGRQLLQYVYSCAMPRASGEQIYSTNLDPNNGTLECGADDSCDIGYECVADEVGKKTCVVPLRGAIGLGVNADETTWWESGNCDESCQRWVSACLLARTNAYGVKVQISMRAPSTAPQKIKDALLLDATEAADFPLREGAFYGNIFQTTPVESVEPDFSGEAEGTVLETPRFYACAGPGSNVPELTKRFCSSQGDDTVIDVPGACLPTTLEPVGVCAGIDDPDDGALRDCQGDGTTYPEVLTVYVKALIAVCGNAVCEATEDSTACASDCHPGSWARSFDANLGSGGLTFFDYRGTSAVSPVDDSIVIAGLDNGDVSLEGPVLPVSGGAVVVAKYLPDGTYDWGTRVNMGQLSRVTVSIGDDGTIALAGWLPQPQNALVRVAKLTAAGELIAGWPVGLGGSGALSAADGQLAVDGAGNVYLGGRYRGTATFATSPVTSFTSTNFATSPSDSDAFLVKLLPNGTTAWAVTTGGIGIESTTSLALDRSGDLLAVVLFGSGVTAPITTSRLLRVSAANGAITTLKAPPPWGPDAPWDPSSSVPVVSFNALVSDASGELYATGSFKGTYDFGPGCGALSATAREFFLVKYSPDALQCRWVARATTICPPDANYCNGLFTGGTLAFDSSNNILVGGRLDGVNVLPFPPPPSTLRGAVVDFGAGPFDNYKYPDVFVASYSPLGAFRWAKQIPMVLQGNLRGMSLDSQGRIVLSGTYSGSMTFDGRLLVNTLPVEVGNPNTYLASFQVAPADASPPVLEHVPEAIVLEATSVDGATGWFMPPTAIDMGNFGTNVSCTPRPFSTFPLGTTTTVVCTGSDPFGNETSASFTVTVLDTTGPVFSGAPESAVIAEAASATGAAVPFDLPTAEDQVDGVVSVSCDHEPGALFPIGTTTVHCSASDLQPNTTSVSFEIVVRDTTPPILPVPSPLTVSATGPGGATVVYTVLGFDSVDGAVAPTCAPASGSLFPIGTTTVICGAGDVAGNNATASFVVTVDQPAYSWSGFLQPINANGSSIFKLDELFPVKFKLTGVSAGITNAVAKLAIAKVSSNVTGTFAEAISTAATDSGNTFRYDQSTGEYIFNLATKTLTAGTWLLSIDLGDGVSRTVQVSLN